jgi:hypothetical protein
VALLRLGPPGSAAPDPLFRHAAARRSSKTAYDMARPVPAEAMAALAAAAAPLRFGATQDPARVAALRDLATRSFTLEMETSRSLIESVELIRLGRAEVAANPDGISVWGPGIEEMVAAGRLTRADMLPGRAGHPVMMERYLTAMAATPAFVWLTSPPGRAAELAAGRDWLRVNLAATGLGLGLHPISQALQEFPEMRAAYLEAHRMLAPEGGVVQMLGRLGYARPVPPTPRWPVDTRIRAV